MDKILVITPTYHGPMLWVDRTIESLKKQTYCNFDCWLVKDGCEFTARWKDQNSSNSCKECKDCKKRTLHLRNICETDSRFSYHVLPINFGGAGWGPRNFAILNTKHEYIAYLDDDNWVEPDHLELLYRKIKEKDVDFVFTGTKFYNSEGLPVGEERLNLNSPTHTLIDTSEIIHKRSLIERFGGWRWNPYLCDWDLIDRWMIGNATWAHTGKITLNYTNRGVGPGGPR